MLTESQARDYLAIGVHEITAKQDDWKRRERYYRGEQDLPYAPQGVNQEYLSLREMAVANWLALAMDTPIQRLRAEGFRTGRDKDADADTWTDVWQANQLDSRQRIPYTQMMVHGRGVMSVWPNAANPRSPIIRPESEQRVHLEMDPEDPFRVLFTVKVFEVRERVTSGLVLPNGVPASGTKSVAVVYDDDSWVRFEKRGGVLAGAWDVANSGTHPLGANPFVPFDNKQDADGKPYSAIWPLIPAQDAINTIRFQTLLAMQFSAYRQRVFTAYDPVLRDQDGNPVFKKNADGTPILDVNGQPVPIINSPGRIGVDRALVFPGKDTKVFDLPESNLDNYIKVLGEFLTDLFAVAQIPPQYLLNRMANLSGDALAGAESTLASLVSDLQRWVGESLEQVMRLANRARGEDAPDLASEVIWADAEARSFAQTVDAITKLVSVGFPQEAAYEMLPGATPQKVFRWLEMQEEQAQRTDPYARLLTGKESADGVADAAAAS